MEFSSFFALLFKDEIIPDNERNVEEEARRERSWEKVIFVWLKKKKLVMYSVIKTTGFIRFIFEIVLMYYTGNQIWLYYIFLLQVENNYKFWHCSNWWNVLSAVLVYSHICHSPDSKRFTIELFFSETTFFFFK